MTERQELWKAMIEYKLCYDGQFEYFSNFTDFIQFGKYLNENVYEVFDEDTLSMHLSQMYDKHNGYAFFDLVEFFTKDVLYAREYYPKEFSDIEEYYFGAKNEIFTYKEAFFADYIASYFYSKIRIEDFIKKLEIGVNLIISETIEI